MIQQQNQLIVSFFFLCIPLLSSFWTTSSGHRCRPFFPPVLPFNFCRAKGSTIPLLFDFHRVLLTHALLFFASQFVRKRKSPYPAINTRWYYTTLWLGHIYGSSTNSGSLHSPYIPTYYCCTCSKQMPETQLAKMSIDLKFVKLTADALKISYINV